MADSENRPLPPEPGVHPTPDRLPNQRDGLPPGALGGMPAEPQGDENRDPPTETPSIPA